MKVEIIRSENAKEPYAALHTSEVTEEIMRISALIENFGSDKAVPVKLEERIVVLRPKDIYMIRIEDERTIVYSKDTRYVAGKRLYEFEQLPGSPFLRISKSCLIHLEYLDYIEPSWGGSMLAVLTNGNKDYISRKYVPILKKRLGL